MNTESVPQNDDKSHICKNCGHELTITARFCPICGQKTTTGHIPLKNFIGELINSALNLDSSLFRTLRYLFIPAYLTKEFFNGKHVSYYKPLRLFFVSLVVLYAVLGTRFFSKIDVGIEKDPELLNYFAQKHFRTTLPEAKLAICYDTLQPELKEMIDSLTSALEGPEVEYDIQFNMSENHSAIPMSDIYELEIDSFFRKHEIESFMGRLVTHQLIRVRKDPDRAIQSFIANTSWMILLLMPVLAIVMKFLYIRGNWYYVEHLVFLFHYHASVFVCLTLYFLALNVLPQWAKFAIPILCCIYLLFAMKSYYRQGWLKTISKYLILWFTYISTLLLFILLTIFISLVIV